MKNLLTAACVVFLFVTTGFAQKSDDHKKAEVFIGYSNGQVEGDFDTSEFLTDRASFNGFNVSVVGNVSKYFGLKADVSGTYKNQSVNFNVPGGALRFDADRSVYNFLGGIQIKNNSSDKVFKPFVHALVGAGRVRINVSNASCPTGLDCSFISGKESETGWAGAFGGGIDLRVNRRVQVRVIQADYNPIRLGGATMNNFRFGAGIVF